MTTIFGLGHHAAPVTAAEDRERWHVSTNSVGGSPTVVDGTVYVGDFDGIVYALDAETGDEDWQFEADDWINSSPTVVDGTVYVGSDDGNVYAIDAGTGDEVWSFETAEEVESSPTVANGTVYVGSRDETVYALDADSGDDRWKFETDGTVTSSPTVDNGTVYIGSWDSKLYALDADTGHKEWEFHAGDDVRSSPTVADGLVFIGSGGGLFVNDTSVYAVDAETGEERWSYEAEEFVQSSPTVADGIVYVGSHDGNVYALHGATGAETWVFETDDVVRSSPTVVDDTVYIGSQDEHLYAIDAASGDERWRFDAGEEIVRSAPTVVDGVLYIGTAVTGFVGVGSPGVHAIDLDATGSSEDSRVAYGTLGHHDSWTGDPSAPAYTIQTPAVFEVRTVTPSPTTVTPGDQVDVEATVENVGEATATQTAFLDVNDHQMDSETVDLAGGEDDTVSFSFGTTGMEPGLVSIAVRTDDDEATASVTVEEEAAEFAVRNLELPDDELEIGTELVVSADVENLSGITDSVPVTFEFVDDAGQEVASDTDQLELDGRASESVSFDVATADLEPGDYSATVAVDDDEASGSVTLVAGAGDADDADDDGTGLGVATGLAGLGGTIYLLKRRLSPESPE